MARKQQPPTVDNPPANVDNSAGNVENVGRKAGKRVMPIGRRFVSGDPRAKPGPGRPPDEFKRLMREMVSREDTLKALRSILADKDHPSYVKALAFAAERGYGKESQPVQMTGDPAAPLTVRVVYDTPDGGQ